MTDRPQPTSVRIGDGWPPALGDDTYTLEVDQSVSPGGAAGQEFSAKYTLTVAGPRFTIAPADLHSRFPAPNTTGTYGALLPQVVLARATLPWERPLSGPLVPNVLPTPFLALLVVSGSGAPEVQPGTVNDLMDPPQGTVGPKLTLAPYESGGDTCAYVDMGLATFTEAVPATTDLEWLAHLRQADTSAKALGEAPPDGWFAVVIANRFPAVSEPSTAYLVSFEGLDQYLPPAGPPAAQFVRMAVLTSWTFIDDGGTEQAFSQALAGLDSAGLAVPPATGSPPEAATLLAQGHVPMRHVTRQAETITSLYRGPLAPLGLADAGPAPSYSCADAALRFDPATGMLDVSYAAAWQLGRLLALGDCEVAQAIYDWRRAHVARAVRLAGRMAMARRFPSLRLGRDPAALLRGPAVRGPVGRLLAEDLESARTLPVVPAPSGGPRRGTLQPAAEQSALLDGLRADPACWLGLADGDDEPVPAVVAAWLGRLRQLYGVPFNLLVPDPRALPTESIRFFHVDPAWIGALTDGALSVGRTTSLDAERDAAVAGLAGAVAATARNAVRADALGLDAAPPAGVGLTGFLLRSTAIASWRGVEIGVYADAARTQPLTLVRLDRVSDNVLLCLADGAIGAVRFTQPTEGLQFGVEATGGKSVRLRSLGAAGTPPIGQGVGTGTLVMRGELIDAPDSATLLAQQLATAGAWTQGTPLTSGDFAVQLLESGQIVDMVVGPPAAPVTAAAPPDAAALLAGGRRALRAFAERELADDRR